LAYSVAFLNEEDLMRSLSLMIVLAFGLQLVVADETKPEPVFSGPQKGEKLAGLPLLNVLAGDSKKIDVVADAKGKPTLLVFFHKRTRPAFGLTNAVMRYAQTKKDKLASAAIFLTDDVTAMESWLKMVKKNFPKDAIYGVSPDGIEGPGAYGLNRGVEVTVIVAKDGKVTDNFALVQPSLQADGPKIVTAVAKAMGEKAPDVSKIFNNRRGAGTPPARPKARQTGLAPELAGLVRAMIQKEATPEQVDAAAAKIEEFIKDRKDYQQQIGTVVNRIIKAKVLERYGTARAQEHLRAWGKKYKPAAEAPKPDKPARRRGDGRKDADTKKDTDTKDAKKTETRGR
jgi:hypothetical protein